MGCELQIAAVPSRRISLVCPWCSEREPIELSRAAAFDMRAMGLNGPIGMDRVMFGCTCGRLSQGVALYCASVEDPAGMGHYNAGLFAQKPNHVTISACTLGAFPHWFTIRREYVTGELVDSGQPCLPRGPFVIEEHLRGPAKAPIAQAEISAWAAAVLLSRGV